jgi:hypothetical protein
MNMILVRALPAPLAAAGLLVGANAEVHADAFSFTSIGQTYTQDFNGYRGTLATLPEHMSVSWDESRTTEPFQGVNTGAFTAYTSTSDDIDYSFGIRERSPVDLRDARLFFEFTNNTGQAISQFQVSYDVEAWFIGNRRNRIRLKFDNTLDDSARDTFETDIFSTDNPSATTTSNTDVDGKLAANRTTVSGLVDITTIDDGTGTFFSALAPGETGYFRWQFSNTDGDGGSLRSGLAIDNLSITAVPEPASLALLGIGGAMMLLRRRGNA